MTFNPVFIGLRSTGVFEKSNYIIICILENTIIFVKKILQYGKSIFKIQILDS